MDYLIIVSMFFTLRVLIFSRFPGAGNNLVENCQYPFPPAAHEFDRIYLLATGHCVSREKIHPRVCQRSFTIRRSVALALGEDKKSFTPRRAAVIHREKCTNWPRRVRGVALHSFLMFYFFAYNFFLLLAVKCLKINKTARLNKKKKDEKKKRKKRTRKDFSMEQRFSFSDEEGREPARRRCEDRIIIAQMILSGFISRRRSRLFFR